MWQNWTNGIVGLVIIGLAFMGLTGATLMWTLLAAGAVVAVAGFWGVSDTMTSTNVRHA